MNWLAQNWLWILVVAGALFVLGRSRYHRHARVSPNRGLGSPRGGTTYNGVAAALQRRPHDTPPSPQIGIAIDPVTRQDVAAATALTSVYQGRIYYFGTAESRQRFEASPTEYSREGLGRAAGPAEQSEEPHHRRRRGRC